MSQHNFDTFLIKTPELFESLVKYESQVDSDMLFFDVETNSEIEKIAKIYGMGLAFTDQKAFYIAWRYKDGTSVWTPDQEKNIITWLNATLTKRKVVGHNILYDTLVYENNFQFNLENFIYSDTILMKHTLEEEPPHALKEIAPVILGQWADKAQEQLKENVLANGGVWTKIHKDMYKADTDILGEYCCWDVMLTLLLFNHFQQKLEDEQLLDFFYKEEVMPLYKEVTINMKRKGFPIDIAYFKDLKKEITLEINTLEDDIITEIAPLIKDFEQETLDKKFPMKPTGNFPKMFADKVGIALPVNSKTGKITLSGKAIKLQAEANINPKFATFYDWLMTKTEPIAGSWIANKKIEIQRELFFADAPDKRYIFNLDSGDHLGYLLFNILGIQPYKFTESKKPSTDKEVIDDLIDKNSGTVWMKKLSDYRKLNKLLSTYIDGILDRQIDGNIYTSMLQYGTTSGRYSSRNPNLQNQPRIKDEDSGLSESVLHYVNAIKRGFVAGEGRKVVNADYASLEPVCFAHVSDDQKLKDVFRNGEDLYSRIGIEVFGITDASANKKDKNYLKNLYPEIRQVAKLIALAIPYGAEAAQVSKLSGKTYKEADMIVNNYLNSFPNLRRYMNKCNYMAKNYGYVKSDLGRVRHLKQCKSIHTLYGDQVLDSRWAKKTGKADIRYTYKNLLNNSKNFPIQALASHIVNRAMLAVAREFKRLNLDAWIGIQVHDEITCIARADQADLVSKILQNAMENTTKISVPLSAEPLIADNWADAK